MSEITCVLNKKHRWNGDDETCICGEFTWESWNLTQPDCIIGTFGMNKFHVAFYPSDDYAFFRFNRGSDG